MCSAQDGILVLPFLPSVMQHAYYTGCATRKYTQTTTARMDGPLFAFERNVLIYSIRFFLRSVGELPFSLIGRRLQKSAIIYSISCSWQTSNYYLAYVSRGWRISKRFINLEPWQFNSTFLFLNPAFGRDFHSILNPVGIFGTLEQNHVNRKINTQKWTS